VNDDSVFDTYRTLRSACLRDSLAHAWKMKWHPIGFLQPRRARWRAPSKSSHIGEFDMISTVQELAAEALFVSDLQPSQCPSRRTVEDTVTAMVLRHGSEGCAGGVAAEFGDHPDAAVERMCWVRSELSTAVTVQRSPHFAS
jgi:hypothetical protein